MNYAEMIRTSWPDLARKEMKRIEYFEYEMQIDCVTLTKNFQVVANLKCDMLSD